VGLKNLMNKVPTPLKQAVKERMYPELLAEGTLAPEWHLQSYDGTWHRMRGNKWSILVFYPSDDTPGCSEQLSEFASHYDELQELGVEVYGVNPAEAESHRAFAEKIGLPFPLLTDRGAGVCRQFSATLPIPYGIKTIRTVYLVNPERKIRMANRGAPSVEAIIRSIQALKVTKGGM